MTSLRIAFMGTPAFAVPALAALIDAGHEVAAVYTQPPRPSGRGHRVQASPVHEYAKGKGIEVRHPASLKPQTEKDAFAALALDSAVVAAYGLILPQAILSAPIHGCLNIHGSLLPRWRGAAPIQRAILAGDPQTGITIMQMEAGLDTGPMLVKDALPIAGDTTAVTLTDAMAAMGARLIVPALEGFVSGAVRPVAQPEEGITYAAKLSREDGLIDWRQAAELADRQVRALVPWPAAWFRHGGEAIKVGMATLVDTVAALGADTPGAAAPGDILDENLAVACGAGVIRLERVQRPGKSGMSGAEFIRAMALKPGDRLQHSNM